MKDNRAKIPRLFGILVVLFGLGGSGLSQSIPNPTPVPWWLNQPDSPLQITLSPKRDRLLIANISNRNVDGFRLGCAAIVLPRMKIRKKFSWKASVSLRAASDGTYPFESLDDMYNEADVCRGGMLIVVAVRFDDGSSLRFSSD